MTREIKMPVCWYCKQNYPPRGMHTDMCEACCTPESKEARDKAFNEKYGFFVDEVKEMPKVSRNK